MSGENTIYDITEDPASAGAFSAIEERYPEIYEVSNNFPLEVPTPGFYGFQLDDRPNVSTLRLYFVDSDYIDTDFIDTDFDGTAIEIITTGTPNATQCRVYEENGWCQFDSDNIGAPVMAVYDSYGSNLSRSMISRMIDVALTEAASNLGNLNNLNDGLSRTTAVDAINDVDDKTGVNAGNISTNTAAIAAIAGDYTTEAEATTIAEGLDQNVVFVKEIQTAGTQGGSSTATTTHTRTLNTIENPFSVTWASLASNQITLSTAGTYLIEASAPCISGNAHKTRWYSVTDTNYDIEGTSEYSSTTNTVCTRSFVLGTVSPTVSTTYELRHYITSAKATNGLGQATSQGNEVYSIVKITKLT